MLVQHLLSYHALVVRLVLAIALGMAVGLERELARQPAGVRTHMLVAGGAALFTAAGMVGGNRTDVTRVAAQVVTGIGFIGAGAILRDRVGVHGLTTAASLWATAAIGLAVGFGFYAGAATFTALLLVVLQGLKRLEDRVSPRLRVRTITVVTAEGVSLPAAVTSVRQVVPRAEVASVQTLDTGETALRLSVPRQLTRDPAALADRLLVLTEVAGVDIRA